jgi:hypothetical protein
MKTGPYDSAPWAGTIDIESVVFKCNDGNRPFGPTTAWSSSLSFDQIPSGLITHPLNLDY